MNTFTDSSTPTARTILFAGEILVCTSMVAGITILLYFLLARRPRAIHLVTANISSFAVYVAPYAMNFMACWYLLLLFERLMLSTHIVVDLTTRYHLASKITLNVAAFVIKQHLFWTRSNCFYKAMLFIGHLVLVAASEAMCYEKYEKTTIHVAMLLLLCLTTLILMAPSNTYQRLVYTDLLTWKRFSLVYGLVTSACHNWLNSGSRGAVDTLLLVLVAHVQLVFLCVTYFSDGQQILRNIVGLGTYNPMADSLDIYFTMDSIVSRTGAYIEHRR
ncbi:uncharacterized protein LOC100573408 [Acyrthosiphon pisum]|uniref:Uncharacterized protein n=1 Tax=Acyrthosiphon pisum TaxID=7029 RepID=A0A8R2AFE5_ACYPI|nr:uncharacterized protein LOC100573408 [Acyrthosiphon pisum]|eukprot:XP_003241275.1 PREDICTED: uncharacterized protein LOC100573408 isoform X1 [Acyrthosiphon pisum]